MDFSDIMSTIRHHMLTPFVEENLVSVSLFLVLAPPVEMSLTVIKKVSAGREDLVNSSPGISLTHFEICVIQTNLVKNNY